MTGTRTKIKIETIVGSIFLAWALGALTFWFSGSRAALEWINDFPSKRLSNRLYIFIRPSRTKPRPTLDRWHFLYWIRSCLPGIPLSHFLFGLTGRTILLGYHAKNSSVFLKSLLPDSFSIWNRIFSRFGQFVCWS